MWTGILTEAARMIVGAARRRRRAPPVADPEVELRVFVARLSEEICRCGPDYEVRGVVPDTFTLVVCLHGQEVPVPLEPLRQHYEAFPDQLSALARQLLDEIEEVGLERPEDHGFVDVATRILPQICPRAWVFENGPAFGDSALVHRLIAADLAVCYVIDGPFSVVFVCGAHLRRWGRSEADLFHLAHQNLRRGSGALPELPPAVGGAVRLSSGDGYDAARVLLLDPVAAADLLIAMPERATLYLGREADRAGLAALMAATPGSGDEVLSLEVYRFEDRWLVPLSGPDRE